ncbi:MAG: Ppx/GppA family phosphatase [Proteobacteria bacterium]|nr:Ppx/GppA family phosphatase [Pseudomonadota bacterium]
MAEKKELYAAVDLGSNSFHMIVASINNNQLHVIDRHKDMVRLANGLDDTGNLSDKKMDEAILSLEKIGQRIAHIPKSHLRIVGTNTLRKAKNAQDFLLRASVALGKPIDIISGREEARILYLGVAHSLVSNQGKRLVIDIGGGSTELIIGEDFTPLLRESLHMGCVSTTKKFFSDGKISQNNWKKAVLDTRRQLLPIVAKYKKLGWNIAIGASGSMRSTAKVLIENQYLVNGVNGINGIEKEGLDKLIEQCLNLGDIDRLTEVVGLSSRRHAVFIGGLAIIEGLFESLNIQSIQISNGALREGMVYDLSGRLHHNNIRQRSIDKLVVQFEVDVTHSQWVNNTIDQLIALSNIELANSQLELLNWAAQLHELGLNISHSHFEKHAAYILSHADMPGFSNQEQLKLSVVVALLRRKIKKEWLQKLSDKQLAKLLPVLIVFRTATLLNRPRINEIIGIKSVELNGESMTIQFKKDWLKNHPLTHEDLQSEAKYLKALGVEYLIV